QKDSIPCSLTYWPKEASQASFIFYLETTLRLAGIKVLVESKDQFRPHKESAVIDIELSDPQTLNSEGSGAEEETTYQGRVLLFLPMQESPLEILNRYDLLDFHRHLNQRHYYLAVFEILRRLLPQSDIYKIIKEFEGPLEAVESDFSLDKEAHSNFEA